MKNTDGIAPFNIPMHRVGVLLTMRGLTILKFFKFERDQFPGQLLVGKLASFGLYLHFDARRRMRRVHRRFGLVDVLPAFPRRAAG